MQHTKHNLLVLGGDGYLGWSLGLALANRTDLNVILVDNLVKRLWEKEVGAKLLVPFKSPTTRIHQYQIIFNRSNLYFKKVDLLNYDAVFDLIKKYRPVGIINAAQQPSAPFSMMSPKHAAITFSNNLIGNLNVLWAIAELDKSIKYIKLGSAGCYLDVDADFVPLQKVDLGFRYKKKYFKVLQSWLPMQATDFYHQSKIDDFLINDLCCKLWNLKVVTIQQSTIFGATIKENKSVENHGLSTRFNYDQIFGTVLNRFVCEIAINHPMIIYGNGIQKTGVISLSDTVDNFIKFFSRDIKPKLHTVEHNYTSVLAIKEIAQILIDLSGFSEIKYIKNPRIESRLELTKRLERNPLILKPDRNSDKNINQELGDLLKFTKLYKENIRKSILFPTVHWEK